MCWNDSKLFHLFSFSILYYILFVFICIHIMVILGSGFNSFDEDKDFVTHSYVSLLFSESKLFLYHLPVLVAT